MSTVWLLLGALNVALLIRAYRPRFCRLLSEEFGPKTPRRRYSHSGGAVDGSNETRIPPRRALLGVLPSRTVQPPRTGRSAQNVKAQR